MKKSCLRSDLSTSCAESQTVSPKSTEWHTSQIIIKRDFNTKKPLEKTVTDISELLANDGKLYVSVIFDCYDLMALGVAMADNMRAELCVRPLENTYHSYPVMKGMIIHLARRSRYTSSDYRYAVKNTALFKV